MNKRKLKFDVRKNDEQKAKKFCVWIPLNLVTPSLVVQFPLSAVLSVTVTDTTVFRSRLAASNQLPPHWLLANESTQVLPEVISSLVLYKPKEHKTLVAATGCTSSVSINSKLWWTVRIGLTQVTSDVFQEFLSTLGSVEHLLQLLRCVDESTYCIGNDDSKFSDLINSRKGRFMDSSRKST